MGFTKQRSTRSVAGGLLMVVALVAGAAPALAKTHGGGSGHGGGGTTTPVGNDISYPQCGGAFPTGQVIGIVGVNDGLANNLNPCFGVPAQKSVTASELYWSTTSTAGTTTQPRRQLYVNTGNPGPTYNGSPITDWPADNLGGGNDPYGYCTVDGSTGLGSDNRACAWQYGWNMAEEDASTAPLPGGPEFPAGSTSFFRQGTSSVDTAAPGSVSTDPTTYAWWLDVETGNSWSSDTTLNDADLEGMVAFFRGIGATVGAYSTGYQWGQIAGTPSTGSSLAALPTWIAGAGSLSGAQSSCASTGFTSGAVMLAQWVASYDDDLPCS